MAEPLVFHFSPDADHHPQALTIVDLRCVCGLCRDPQYQRFYHGVPFHSLTRGALVRHAREAHLKAGYDCENCGESVGPQHVEVAMLRYGFPDHTGELLACVREPQGDSAQVQYQLIAGRRLDPQVQPKFALDEADGPVMDTLSDEALMARLGRVFSVKQAWRALWRDWSADPEGGAWAQLAPGAWALLDRTDEEALSLLDGIDEVGPREDLLIVPLLDSAPTQLATYLRADALPGRLSGWLAPAAQAALGGGPGGALAPRQRAPPRAVRGNTFNVARLSFERWPHEGGGVMLTHIETPREGSYSRDVIVDEVLRRALYTGITPGEAARLTAEEIIGLLMGVWSPATR